MKLHLFKLIRKPDTQLIEKDNFLLYYGNNLIGTFTHKQYMANHEINLIIKLFHGRKGINFSDFDENRVRTFTWF